MVICGGLGNLNILNKGDRLISKNDWENWLDGLMEYKQKYYPNSKITEKDIIALMFKSFRTIYMEQLIIDFDENGLS